MRTSPYAKERGPLRGVLTTIAVIAIAAAVPVAIMITFAAVGDDANWIAVGALSQIVATATGLVLAGSLYFGVHEARERRLGAERDERRQAEYERRERIRHLPYLRVDVAFLQFHQPGLRPPVGDDVYVYSPGELGLGETSHRALGSLQDALGPGPGEMALSLRLYLTNLQTEPLAIADAIDLRLGFSWERNDVAGDQEVSVLVRYLAPRQTFCLELLQVSVTVQKLAVKTLNLRYEDITGGRNYGGHGAFDMFYYTGEEGSRASVRNHRGTIREIPRLP